MGHLPVYQNAAAVRTNELLFRRTIFAAGQPACPQVGRSIGLPASDREYPALTGRSGTRWARGGQADRQVANTLAELIVGGALISTEITDRTARDGGR
jgi:hypothetical protein